MKKVLIIGGSGMVGLFLTAKLTENKYEVAWLGRSLNYKNVPQGVKTYLWNPIANYIDKRCLSDVSIIINLAGSGISDQRWTKKYKKTIYNSRVATTNFLAKTLKQENAQVKIFISASAIGIYGYNREGIVNEQSSVSDSFLAKVCLDWELAACNVRELNIRAIIFRLGVVMSKSGGFLAKLLSAAKFGLAAPFAGKDLATSWIHIDDLTEMFLFAIENDKIDGIFNAVAPFTESNKIITHEINNVLGKFQILPSIPKCIVKLIFGEMSDVILSDINVSSEKIVNAGFKFQFPSIKMALKDLIK